MNLAYDERLVQAYLNDSISVLTVTDVFQEDMLDENGVRVVNTNFKRSDMLYLTEICLKTYELNNPDTRIRLEKNRQYYMKTGEHMQGRRINIINVRDTTHELYGEKTND
ncbi:hypothetical protein [Weissella ceti]|nr:hypothetical protein [Weissella ceti]